MSRVEVHANAISTLLSVEEYDRALKAKVSDKPLSEGKKYDQGKLDYTLLPFEALAEVVDVLGFGLNKYGRDNWQKVERQRYIAAAFRHLVEIAKGNEIDNESGNTHAAHLACCALFLGTTPK